ncbi:MAG: N-acetylmuramoyl-L-alanine amidase [Clostridia bacterium]|nr:N-acetylmuramoyl-L-alanine amidase [Clostridia bacterium]
MAVKIYIDQGHNPVNPNAGAEGNGYREQDIVYKIGVRLAEVLGAAGLETKLSRPTASTQLGTSNATSLSSRVNEANSWGADFFLSLHTNASSSPSAAGTEAYVYSIPGAAQILAENIVGKLSNLVGFRNRGVYARPTLYVLRKTRMPAVLVELGFITNPYEATLMASQPDLFAAGVADGVLSYLGLY